MNRKIILVVQIIWFSVILLDLLSGTIGISHKVAVFFPAVYFTLSFFVFNRLIIGYRLFHHICISFLMIYYLLGVIFKIEQVFNGPYAMSYMAYSWFATLAITYLVFCFMLFIFYMPYVVYKKVSNKSAA